jgi:hypothetical protein
LFTPSGTRVVDFAPGDHRHHRGVFLAWHATSCGAQRADFWGWGKFAPTENRVIRNQTVKTDLSDTTAIVHVVNHWMIGEKTAMVENLTITAREQQSAFVIDLDFQFSPQVDVTLNQTAFGGFCVKGRKDGKPTYFNPAGKVVLPNPHHLKPETDWPAADWYDYVVELDDGKTIGIAVFDHPENPPSVWHNLEPIAMVNPCIVAPGDVALKKDKPFRLRYRLVAHDSQPPLELLGRLNKQWRATRTP